jgi:hypothetical protein
MTLHKFRHLMERRDPAMMPVIPVDLVLADGTRLGDHPEAKDLPVGKRFGDYVLAQLKAFVNGQREIAYKWALGSHRRQRA